MKSFEIVRKNFRSHALTIRSLARDDPSFRELCEDYEEATTAVAFWQEPHRRSEERVIEYRHLVIELEAEIEAALAKRTPEVAHKANR